VAAYATIPDLVIVPDVAIAAKNKVRSILLVSKVPLDKIRSVATDDSSRTSAALVEIYLRKFVGTDPGFTRQKPSLKEMLQWHDAALLIGDPALQTRTDGYFVYDLAEEWQRWTSRPFVFAFWAVRKAALQGRAPEPNLAQVFQQSRDNGRKHIPEIADAWAPKLTLALQHDPPGRNHRRNDSDLHGRREVSASQEVDRRHRSIGQRKYVHRV
jgi:chorismate dehydratase